MSFNSKKIARAGIIASLYVVLSLIAFPIANGAIQFRPSEGLCLLPLLYFESIPALFIGCIITNLILGGAVYDVLLGSLITLLSAICTFLFGRIIKNLPVKIAVSGLFPVLLNAFLLPLIWFLCYGKLQFIYIVQVVILIISQSLSVYLLGTFLYLFLNKRNR